MLLLMLTPSLVAQVDWAKVHLITVRGIDQLYGLEMDSADVTFDEVIRIAPDDPRGYFFKAMIHFWIYNFNRDSIAQKKFFDLSERVIDICERRLTRNKDDATAKFFLGGIYGYRGLAYQRDGSILKAAWDGRKGYGFLKEAVSDTTMIDAQMGFGLFSYLVAKVPKSFRWILNVLGFSGDLEGGLNSLKLAAEKGTYTRSEAAFYLSAFLYNERRYDEAYLYLRRLLEKHPENTLFLILYAQWEFRQERLESALQTVKKAIEINERKKVKYGGEFAYSVLATYTFLQGDFAGARVHYESYLKQAANPRAVPNTAYYRLGICYELTGDRGPAIWAYSQMQPAELGKGNPWDAYYYRKGQELLKRPLDEIDRTLILADNAQSLKKYTAARNYYNSLLQKNPIDNDRLALALYGLAQIAKEEEKFDEALRNGQRLLALKFEREAWLYPHTYLLLGQIYARQGAVAEARRVFEAAKRYDRYDFQMRVESRIEEELEKLGRGT
jgi:tetratricopeptide (TPR) repeat protein